MRTCESVWRCVYICIHVCHIIPFLKSFNIGVKAILLYVYAVALFLSHYWSREVSHYLNIVLGVCLFLGMGLFHMLSIVRLLIYNTNDSKHVSYLVIVTQRFSLRVRGWWTFRKTNQTCGQSKCIINSNDLVIHNCQSAISVRNFWKKCSKQIINVLILWRVIGHFIHSLLLQILHIFISFCSC